MCCSFGRVADNGMYKVELHVLSHDSIQFATNVNLSFVDSDLETNDSGRHRQSSTVSHAKNVNYGHFQLHTKPNRK